MFFDTGKNDHGLPYNPFKSICVPRPIAWVSTVSISGKVNVAPFSQFTNLSYDPPCIVMSLSNQQDGRFKDTAQNIFDTKEFVVNMATYEMREQVEQTSQVLPPGINEAELAGLEMIPSRMVQAPRIAKSPVQMECRLHSTLSIPGKKGPHHLIVGSVIGIHIRDDVINAEGKLDILKIRPLARLGYLDYTSVETMFTMMPTGEGAEASIRGRAGQA
jgi:flavin reductase (DIM6/NTAB) family NADH-FMN oxidoreductase RutF